MLYLYIIISIRSHCTPFSSWCLYNSCFHISETIEQCWWVMQGAECSHGVCLTSRAGPWQTTGWEMMAVTFVPTVRLSLASTRDATIVATVDTSSAQSKPLPLVFLSVGQCHSPAHWLWMCPNHTTPQVYLVFHKTAPKTTKASGIVFVHTPSLLQQQRLNW